MFFWVSVAHASEKSAEAGGGIGELMFGPHSLVYWTAISFFIVLGVLSRFAYRPILDTLEKRSQKIREAIDQAEGLRKEADELFKAYELKIKEAQNEAQKLINEGRDAGARLQGDILKEAEERSRRIAEEAQQSIVQERDKAMAALQDHVADLTVQIAGKVIGKSLDEEEHRALIEQSIAEIGGKSAV